MTPADVRSEGSFDVMHLPSATAATFYQGGIAADGSAALGIFGLRDAPDYRAFHWSVDGSIRVIEPPPESPGSILPLGLSADGRVAYVRQSRSLSTALSGETARWTTTDGTLELLGPVGDNGTFHAVGVSADGGTLLGSAAFARPGTEMEVRVAVWSETTGLRIIGGDDTDRLIRPLAISGHGRIVVAQTAFPLDRAFADEEGILQEMAYGSSPLTIVKSNLVLSQHGDVLLGAATVGPLGERECLAAWPLGGEPRCLAELEADPDRSYRFAATGDGDRIVGATYGPLDLHAPGFVWDAHRGVRSIREFLGEEAGLDLSALDGFELNPLAISPDGRVIVGDAHDLGYENQVVWRAILEPRCDDGFDNDGDGAIDFPDDPGCDSPEGVDESRRDDVAIDVQPRHDPNTISFGRPSIVTIALLGSTTFDVDTVEASSLRSGPAGAKPFVDLESGTARRSLTRDIDRDGDEDLTLMFATTSLGLALDDEMLCVEGIAEADAFEACDTIEILVPGCGEGFALSVAAPAAISYATRRRRRAH